MSITNMNETFTFFPHMNFLHIQHNMQPSFFYPRQSTGLNIQPLQDNTKLTDVTSTPPPTQHAFTTSSPTYESAGIDIQWGFLLENTLFTAFDLSNQWALELAYRQPNRAQTKWIEITDSHLDSKAKVYFGVESNHLRMPGTRYNVVRRNVSSRQCSFSNYAWIVFLFHFHKLKIQLYWVTNINFTESKDFLWVTLIKRIKHITFFNIKQGLTLVFKP